jgi:hypothetical protein
MITDIQNYQFVTFQTPHIICQFCMRFQCELRFIQCIIMKWRWIFVTYGRCCLMFSDNGRAVLVETHEWGLVNEVLVYTVTPCQIWILFMYTLGIFTYTNVVPTQSCLCWIAGPYWYGGHLLTANLQSAKCRDRWQALVTEVMNLWVP